MDCGKWKKSQGLSRFELACLVGGLGLVLVLGTSKTRLVVQDRKLVQAEKDLLLLKTAVMSYWSHHKLRFPADVHRSLSSTQPMVIKNVLKDPWGTDPQNLTYGFVKALNPNIGEYFILYTQGPKRDTQPRLNAASQVIEYSGSGIVVSNLPIKKIN
jgi:hypothetical protein